MQQIIIAGDSWGLGEWNLNSVVTHKGIEQYFINSGFTVHNCCGSGFSDYQSLASLSNCLEKNFKTGDIVFWIQSDPSRNLNTHDLTEQYVQAGGLFKLFQQTHKKIYSDFQRLAEKYNIIINAIGGLYNIDLNVLPQKINPVVPSWLSLLLGPVNHGVVRSITLKDFNLSKLDYTQSTQLINEMYLLDTNYQRVLNNRILFPDCMHPARHGHKIVFDILRNYVNEASVSSVPS